MVGFGSALRRAERRGWEEAYVDYQSLKLLLTQIEAVYEESATTNISDNVDVHDDEYFDFDERSGLISSSTPSTKGGGGGTMSSASLSRSKRKKRRRRRTGRTKGAEMNKKKMDYRDELFIESDSSVAYASLSDENDPDMNNGYNNETEINRNDSIDLEGAYIRKNNSLRSVNHEHLLSGSGGRGGIMTINNHLDESSQIQIMDNDNVPKENTARPRSPRKKFNSVLPDDAFKFSYPGPNYVGTTIRGGDSAIHYGESSMEYKTFVVASDATAGFGMEAGSEKEGTQQQQQQLLSHQEYHDSSYPFNDQFYEPPYPMVYSPIASSPIDMNGQQFDSAVEGANGLHDYEIGSHPQIHHNHYHVHNQHRHSHDMWMHHVNNEERYQQQQNKRKPLQHKKKKKKKKSHVPLHIRVAHSKARAITERFLGLLRAEVDKICLFTHSRMGELTDTCGSLRFPSDQMEYDEDRIKYFDNHLGPSHLSASSSDDESPPPQQFLSNTPNDVKGRDDHKFVKPPLFPKTNRRRKKNDAENRALDEVLSDEDDSIIQTTTLRQIKVAEELRCGRPTFQRSDYVLGEDFLLLSAVDEADAYTTTCVEFLHLLKYICVNAIAIRKLCRKHDRLLASRMLGGYYHRLKKSQPNSYAISEFRNRRNNRLRQRKGKMEMREHRLTGVYDSMVMSLANNSVAQDLSESLNLALSEYEVSRQRADALTKLQERNNNESHVDVTDGNGETCFHFPRPSFRFKNFNDVRKENNNNTMDNDKEESDDGLSTSSSISLTRLRFAVASIVSIREASKLKNDYIDEFFSRSMMATDCTTSTVIGECMNMHGCSSEYLRSLSQYNPDCTILDDSHLLKRSLTIENNSCSTSYRLHNKSDYIDDFFGRSEVYLNAVPINSPIPTTKKVSTSNEITLRQLNFSSVFLTTLNYYIIVPSAASFCFKAGGRYIDSVLLICAPSMASLFGILYEVYRSTTQMEKPQGEMFVKRILLSTLFPLIGNILYTVSYERRALWFAFFSRFIIGLPSCDAINKDFVMCTAEPNNIAKDIASMRKLKVGGVGISLLIGSLVLIDDTEFEFFGHLFNIGFETMPGYLMFFSWATQLLFFALLLLPNSCDSKELFVESNSDIYVEATPSASEYEDYPTQSPTPAMVKRHHRSPTDQSKLEYYMKKLERNFSESSYLSEDQRKSSKNRKKSPTKTDLHENTYEIFTKTMKLIIKEFALPTTMVLVTFCNVTIEIVMSSFIVVTHRYFNWSGSRSGLFLAMLAILIIPLNIAASFLSGFYGERRVVKKCLVMILIALIAMINYQSLYILICEILLIFRQYFNVGKETSHSYYDWNAGMYQYSIGTFLLFVSAMIMEATSLNLMSKVSNEKLNSSKINCNVLIPFIECLGKVLGGTIVFLVGVSHHLIYSDIVNSITFLLIGITVLCRYLVKKHYFFLYGDN